MKSSPRDRLALALDNISTLGSLETLVRSTAPWIGVFKVGLEQFTRFGPPVLDVVRRAQRGIFLDLKFHDIPNTVEKAVLSAGELCVTYLTVHAQGGRDMLLAAKRAADAVQQRTGSAPKIIGVTLLTSISEAMLHSELGVAATVEEQVRRLALLAVEAGIDGIVCSAGDLPSVKPLLPQDFAVITPGIRPAGADVHDQKRVGTPQEALRNGATLLVLGRAVTGAGDPGKAAEEIARQISFLQ